MSEFLSQIGIEQNCCFTRKNSYATKLYREMHNEQFPLYIERCRYFYEKYFDTKFYDFNEIWERIIITKKISLEYLNTEWKAKLKDIHKHVIERIKLNNNPNTREAYYMVLYFVDSFTNKYTKPRILNAIKNYALPKKEKKPMKKIAFKQFFEQFFPGCQLSKTRDDATHIPDKFARAYYNKYLKSGQTLKEFDNDMTIV